MRSPHANPGVAQALKSGPGNGGRSAVVLSVACVGFAALLCVLWLFAQRSSSAGEDVRTGTPAAAGRTEPLRRVEPPQEPDPARVSVAVEPPAEPEAAPAGSGPATVSGRLTIDGLAPDEGRARLRVVDGVWAALGVLDHEGRFGFADVPAQALVLAFELVDLEPLEARQLLLPEVEVRPEPGASEDLQLDWRTRQVNVRVVSDAPEGCRASLRLTGPHTSASLETDDAGKARLSLVGDGTFRFHALQRSGREGESELELGGESELESVVIHVAPPAR